MKSKEFGASYRTYRAKSQSMLVETQLAQPHSSVRVLTESINRSPVEFMQYFRTIMEAPPKVRVEPKISSGPTATPGGQSMFTRSSSILGPDGKPIKTQTLKQAFDTVKKAQEETDEVKVKITIRGNSEKVRDMVDKGIQLQSMTPEIKKEVEQLPSEKKTIVKRMFKWLSVVLGGAIATSKWLLTALGIVATAYWVLDTFFPGFTGSLRGWGESTLETIRGWVSSSKETTPPASSSDNVTPLPLPQPGTPANTQQQGTPANTQQQGTPANTQQQGTPAGPGSSPIDQLDQNIQRAIRNLWGSLNYTLTALSA
jgi:flagellar hook-basal body complex protein FliE